jgi:hypothetical protein
MTAKIRDAAPLPTTISSGITVFVCYYYTDKRGRPIDPKANRLERICDWWRELLRDGRAD